MQSAKERAISCRTLICFLQSLENEKCAFELKNDHQLIGKIKSVDSSMNVELEDVKHKKPKNSMLDSFDEEFHEYLFLKGDKIRYVQFDDGLDIKQTIKKKLNEYHHRIEQKRINFNATKRSETE